jgi:predicted aspartyl protease
VTADRTLPARPIAALLSFGLLLAAPAHGASGASATSKASAPEPRAWPTSYASAGLTLSELLRAAALAQRSASATQTLRLTYEVRDGGLDGIERDVYRGDDYRSDVRTGPFSSADGRYAGKQWALEENGYLRIQHGLHLKAAANARVLAESDPGDAVTLLGRLHAPVDAYVVRVAPSDGREELVFYDAASYHLIRREAHYLARLIVTTYDDYRTAGGVTEAYRETFSDGHPENDAARTLTEMKLGPPASEAELQIPSAQRHLVEFPAGAELVRLPARIDDWGRIIVRVDIGGRGLDFQLDSGCDEIVLDRDLAKELGLQTYGRWSRTVAGTFTAAKAIVPKMQVGGLSMSNVVVSTLPFHFQNDRGTKVVGLLGYDFIAGGVFKLDYEHGTVDAMRYGAELPTNAFVTDVLLDDDVPMISVGVGGRDGDHFILDTGADSIVLFSAFTKRYPDMLPDERADAVSASADLITSEGVGGELRTSAVRVEELTIGTVTFHEFLSLVTTGDQPDFEGEDTDGLVGASVLSAFDVYLDYENSRVGFVTNQSALHNRSARGMEPSS